MLCFTADIAAFHNHNTDAGMMRQGLERRLLAANEQLKEVGDEKHKLSLLKDQLEKVRMVYLECTTSTGFG